MTWDKYLSSIPKIQYLFKAKYEEVEIDEADKAFSQGLQQHVSVQAIGEDWPTEVYNNLPVMARVVALTPKTQLRIFPHDQHHELMQRYLFRGQSQSIPAFEFFDANFQEFAQHTGGWPKLL